MGDGTSRMDNGQTDGLANGDLSVLLVVAPDPELEAEAAERAVRRLRSEIADLEVESVRSAPGAPAPEGAKGADPITLGAIVVAFGDTIEPERATEEERRTLVDAYIRRHSDG